MKKRVVALLVCGVMAMTCFTGCGSKEEAKEETKTEAVAETKEETKEEVKEEAVEEEAADEEVADEEVADEEYDDEEYDDEESAEEEYDEEESEEASDDNNGFSLLDVDSTMINCGYYAVEDGGEEVVFSLFTAPDETPYCSLFVLNADQTAGDFYVGDYTNGSSTETDEDGIDWTYITFDDVYTGNTIEIGIVEADDGSAVIVSPDGTTYNCKGLTAEETVNYMGTAIALIDATQQ